MQTDEIVTSGPVLVTGAGKGLGAATARALAKGGVEPLLLGRSCANLASTRADIEPIWGRQVRTIVADVANWDALRVNIVQALLPGERLGGVINNAGVIEPIDKVQDSDPACWADCIQINLIGAYHVLRVSLPHLSSGGIIINVSSGAAVAELQGWSAYAASKAGLERLSMTLASERPDLIVLAVRPGMMDTDMQAIIRNARVDNMVRQVPREDMQLVDEPAKAIANFFTHKAVADKMRFEGVIRLH
ncbi:SDR family NAD(P)-dependent oxidoreductase [Henriciella sp.]|uniref:SDR family NAD(P)-dependent oxidoreductase n=1 Tax=Henriciella sp. TaxID=1968823 RepID=UPI0026177AC0|nr:SDR family NAD(P)-dependent oxidoreductase [Henriciella sp.]